MLPRTRWLYLGLGLALRLFLLGWGAYQDRHASLAYTDIDYAVYNDGARALWTACPLSSTVYSDNYEDEEDLFNKPELAAHVHCARGIVPAVSRFVLQYDPGNAEAEDRQLVDRDSLWSWPLTLSFYMTRPLFRFFASLGDPFTRETYRYTPFLALLMGPAHSFDTLWPWCGKLLFVLADVGCALLMWAILDERILMHAFEAPGLRTSLSTHLPGILWLLNPFPAQIATRGSADSLIGVLVLGTLYLLICATPEMSLVRTPTPPKEKAAKHDPRELRVANSNAWYGAAFLLALAVHFKLFPIIYGASILAHLINYRRHAIMLLCGIEKPRQSDVLVLGLEFTALAAIMYILLNTFAWAVWGQPYIRHALLYHLARLDHRHNFSIYFLPTYLSMTTDSTSSWWAWIAPWTSFLPQLVTVALSGFWLGGFDVVLACMVQTIVFVAWNKVYTSQYFLWYLWFVPIVGVTMHVRSTWHVATLLALWVAAQAVWLSQAYRLEFLAKDTFVYLWLSSLALLFVHVCGATYIVQAWSDWRARQSIAVEKSQ